MTRNLKEPVEDGADQKDYIPKELMAQHSTADIKISNPVLFFIANNWFSKLFFRRKFGAHRIMGLLHLIQFVATIILYSYDYQLFLASPLWWSLPLTGLIQSITAVFTFTFMPKVDDPGFIVSELVLHFVDRMALFQAMADKAALSYNFIVENSFFELILLWQWLYFSDPFYAFIREHGLPIELIFVFLPYFLRPMWPKTRMFIIISTWIVKVFYIFAKHFIGFYLNYIRFLGRITPAEQHIFFGLSIVNSYATTIAIFLHTLKFKGYLGPRSATFLYEVSYLFHAYFFFQLSPIFMKSPEITLLTLIGVVMNLGPMKLWHAYQVFVMVILMAKRNGLDLISLDKFVSNFVTSSAA